EARPGTQPSSASYHDINLYAGRTRAVLDFSMLRSSQPAAWPRAPHKLFAWPHELAPNPAKGSLNAKRPGSTGRKRTPGQGLEPQSPGPEPGVTANWTIPDSAFAQKDSK